MAPRGHLCRPGAGRSELTDTRWPEVQLKPARKLELRRWFAEARQRLQPGDMLLFFVTDHGIDDDEDPANAYISLWKESLSVLELRALLAHLRPGVRVVELFSQCYSGAFAASIAPLHGTLPGGDVCGFYSTTGDRRSYGCYREGRDRDRSGHAFAFIDALHRHATLDAAHVAVTLVDATPDLPLRS